jgi:hypothetical protein
MHFKYKAFRQYLLMPISTIFQLYHGGQFKWQMNLKYLRRNHLPAACHFINYFLFWVHHPCRWIKLIDSEGWLRTKLYEKRDDFNFLIVNFLFVCSNIPATTAYGVYIFQLMRYSRAGGFYQDFLDRFLQLTRKLLNQGFLLVKLKSSLRKFYGRHHDLVNRYGISVSQMTTDMFHLS